MRRPSFGTALGIVGMITGAAVVCAVWIGRTGSAREGFVGFLTTSSDFGRVYNPKDAFAEFTFMNNSRNPLTLDAHTCCGVSARWIDNNKVPSGESTKLRLSYNSRPGLVNRRIHVTSSTGARFPLDLTGECLCGVRPNPLSGVLIEIPETRQSATQEALNLDSDDEIPFSVLNYRIEGTDIVTVLPDDDLAKSMMSHSLKLSVSPGGRNVEKGRLVLATSHPQAQEVIVPVCIRFVGDVAIRPSAFVLGRRSRTAKVQVYSRSGSVLHLQPNPNLPSGYTLGHLQGDGTSQILTLEATQQTDLGSAPGSVSVLIDGVRRRIPVVVLSDMSG